MNLNDALKYSAADEKALLKLMASHEDHRKAGAATRLIAADYFDEQGNKEFADFLRSPHPLPVEQGTGVWERNPPKILKSSLKLHRLLTTLAKRHPAYDATPEEGAHRQADPLSAEAAAELERLGRTDEAEMLRSAHPLKFKDGLVRGAYPEFAWPGGSTLVYLDGHYADICPQCRNGANGSPFVSRSTEPDESIAGVYPHDEGPPRHCEYCSKPLIATYGDPDTEEDDQ